MFQGKNADTNIQLSTLIGLLEGIAVYLIVEFLKVGGDLPPKYMALLSFVIVAPSTYILTSTRNDWRGPAFFSLGLAALVATLYLMISGLFGAPDMDKGITAAISICSAIVLSYVGIGFYRAHRETGSWTRYPALFEQAWNLPIIIAISYFFFGLGMGVLFLWGALFKLIDISFFADLFQKDWFAIPVYFTLLALGLSVIRQWERVINTLGGVAVSLLRFISPVLTLFSTLFLISLLTTGLEPLWQATSATVTTTVMVFLAALVLTAVAAGDDIEEGSAHAIFLWSARLQALLLPAFAGIAVYSLWLRVDQYGWNIDRLLAALFVGFAMVLAMAYALSALTPAWTRQLRSANIGLALLAATLGILVQTPFLNPFAISASSQIARLESGKVSASDFDFGYLRFKLGRSGQKALAALKEKSDLADHKTILTKIEETEAQDYYVRPNRPEDRQHIYTLDEMRAAYGDRFQINPEDDALNPEFEASLLREEYLVRTCMEATEPCLIIGLDLFGDDTPEYLVAQAPAEKYDIPVRFFYFEAGSQTWTNQWRALNRQNGQTPQELWQALKNGNLKTYDIKSKAIDVDGSVFVLLPSDPATMGQHPVKQSPTPTLAE